MGIIASSPRLNPRFYVYRRIGDAFIRGQDARGLAAAGDAKLAAGFAKALVDGAGRHAELGCHALDVVPPGKQPEHLALACRETREASVHLRPAPLR